MKNTLLTLLLFLTVTTSYGQFSLFNDVTSGPINDPYELVPVDLDMDGDLDLVIRCWNYLTWQENLGFEEFAPAVEIFADIETQDIAVVDFDYDGDNDIIVSNTGGFTRLLLNDGDEGFTVADLPEIMGVALFKLVDFDADGDLDMVGSKFSSIVWLEGDGTGAIIDEHILTESIGGLRYFYLADIDLDGDQDVLYCGNDDDGVVYMAENLGGGVFDDRVLVDSGMSFPTSIFATDVDNDGDLDIIYGSWSYDDGGIVQWCENMGGGIFGVATVIGDDHLGEIHITAGDIDLDGDFDIVVSSEEDG